MWDLDYFTSMQHTKLYTQTMQGLADYAQKFMHYTSLQHPTLRLLCSEQLDGARLLASYNYAA